MYLNPKKSSEKSCVDLPIHHVGDRFKLIKCLVIFHDFFKFFNRHHYEFFGLI